MHWEIHPPRPSRFPSGGDFAPLGEEKEEKTKSEGRLTAVEHAIKELMGDFQKKYEDDLKVEKAKMKEMMNEFKKKYEDDLKIERAKIEEKLSALEVEKLNNGKVVKEEKTCCIL